MPLDRKKAAQLKRFGEWVREERKKKKLTQERLAELVDVETRTIQRVEAGTLNILVTTAMRIAQALGYEFPEVLRSRS